MVVKKSQLVWYINKWLIASVLLDYSILTITVEMQCMLTPLAMFEFVTIMTKTDGLIPLITTSIRKLCLKTHFK